MNPQLIEAWDMITKSCLTQIPAIHSQNCLQILHQNSFLEHFQEWAFEIYKNKICFEVLPSFWSSLDNSANRFGTSNYQLFFDEFAKLYHSSLTWINNPVIKMSFEDEQAFAIYQSKMKSLLQALLVTSPPISFNNHLLETFSRAFKINQHQSKIDLNSSGDSSFETQNSACPGCEVDFKEDSCKCDTINKQFLTFIQQIKQLNLLEALVGDAVTSVIHSFIEQHIKAKCQGNFEVSCIESLKLWIQHTVIRWVNTIYDGSQSQSYLNHLEERSIHFLYETYAHYRMEQLFDIIIEFPDSEASLEDLRECLEKCANFRSKLIKSLKESFELRLLHPGVSTSDILAAYISAIKALRVLDQTGVILQLVCEPVRKYLKIRDDTVRCIITTLTDDNSSELTPDFVKGNQHSSKNTNYSSDDENVSDNWQDWQPDPIDAAQDLVSSKTLRSLDIVSILVNIYESKDLFVEEYQRLLGQRLLTNFDFNIENERRNLELLTLRFGESDLHACEVMLKDVTMSKRISNRINTGEIETYTFDKFTINSLILSAQFWPEKFGLTTNEDVSGLKLPPEMIEGLEMFNKAFETIKVSRTLNWIPHLGLVQLELEFGDKKLNFSVTPIQATIIHHFQDKQNWTIAELSEMMSIPPSILRKRIAFWQNKGILKETKTDKFELINDQRTNLSSNVTYANDNPMDMEDDFDVLEEDKNGTSGQDERERKFAIYWSFVHNMLNNLNSLSLERIHTMLQVFAMQGANSGELTTHELRHFLDAKVREQKLVYSGGHYKLPENAG